MLPRAWIKAAEMRSVAPLTSGIGRRPLLSAHTMRRTFVTPSLRPAAGTPWIVLSETQRRSFINYSRMCLDAAKPNPTDAAAAKKSGNSNMLQGFKGLTDYKPPEDEKANDEKAEEEQANADAKEGYLPFPPPLHTINIMSLLLLGNVLVYLLVSWSNNDDVRDMLVDHFTLSHDNYWKIYPFFTSAFYQEHLLQLVIDGWLLFQFGSTMLGFLGNKRLTFFWGLCMLTGGTLHIVKQHIELYLGMDPLEVRGRVYGANPFILGMVGVEGLIFRHLNFMQNPPVPFLVLTAFVMVIDVWRIFTMKPEEHGASTGGALTAYVFWALPTRLMGLNKLTAAI